MKRILLLLMALTVCGLTACGPVSHTITTAAPGTVSRLVVTRLEDGEQAELTKKDDAAELLAALELLTETPVTYRGDCTGEAGHCYGLRLYMGETCESEIFLHQNGALCRSGKLREPEDAARAAALLAHCEELMDRLPEESVVEEGCWEPVSEPTERAVPMPVPSAARWHGSLELETTGDGWRYIQGEVEVNGVRYTVAARERVGQTTEILYGFSVRNAGSYTLSYVEELFETSDGTLLGFELLGPEPPAPAEGEEPRQRLHVPCYFDIAAGEFRLGTPPELPAGE